MKWRSTRKERLQIQVIYIQQSEAVKKKGRTDGRAREWETTVVWWTRDPYTSRSSKKKIN